MSQISLMSQRNVFNQPNTYGVADKIDDGAESEFAKQVGAMALHGLDTEAQRHGEISLLDLLTATWRMISLSRFEGSAGGSLEGPPVSSAPGAGIGFILGGKDFPGHTVFVSQS